MKHLFAAFILLFGGIATYGVMFAIALSNSFSGWGDGSLPNITHTPLWSAWPSGLFFAMSAVGPYFRKRGDRVVVYAATLIMMFLCFEVVVSGANGLFFALSTGAASLLVWIPLLIWVPGESQGLQGEA